MKKIAMTLVFFLFVFVAGCDFLTTKTTTSQTTSQITAASTSTAVSTTSGAQTTTQTIVDDVSYDDLFDNSNYKKFVIYFSEANF